jgi:hypothetical protein
MQVQTSRSCRERHSKKKPLPLPFAHRVDNLHRLDADACNAFEKIDHRFLVIGKAVGIEPNADRRVLWLALPVLV